MRSVIFLLVALALSLNVNAISFASDYLVNGSLIIVEGGSKIYSISLQNPEDYPVRVRVDYDPTYMEIIDYQEIYTLQPRETGYRVLFNVTPPKKPGMYRTEYTVSEMDVGGGLSIRLKINKNLNIKVIDDPDKFYLTSNHVTFAAITLGFLIFVYFKWKPAKPVRRKSRKIFIRRNRKIIK